VRIAHPKPPVMQVTIRTRIFCLLSAISYWVNESKYQIPRGYQKDVFQIIVVICLRLRELGVRRLVALADSRQTPNLP
jgi:hypothetical protein